MSPDVDLHGKLEGDVDENELSEIVHPAVDFVYHKAHDLVKAEKSQQQQSYDDLIAWKFNPDRWEYNYIAFTVREAIFGIKIEYLQRQTI